MAIDLVVAQLVVRRVAVLTALQLIDHFTTPCLPAIGVSGGHVSPFDHVRFPGSAGSPSHAVGSSPRSIESSDTPQPPYPRNLPRVALSPPSERVNGWVWMKPSPWVWMPGCTFGLSCTCSNSPGADSHSPQMFTANAECQWSPASPVAGLPGCGGPAASLLSARENTMPTTPSTTIAAIAP